MRAMLSEYVTTGQCQLGEIGVSEDRIKIKEGVKPVFCQPYRAGRRVREAERKLVEDMLASGVI